MLNWSYDICVMATDVFNCGFVYGNILFGLCLLNGLLLPNVLQKVYCVLSRTDVITIPLQHIRRACTTASMEHVFSGYP